MPKTPFDIRHYLGWLALWGLSLEGIGQELSQEQEADNGQNLLG